MPCSHLFFTLPWIMEADTVFIFQVVSAKGPDSHENGSMMQW